jgi:hypothetical protein
MEPERSLRPDLLRQGMVRVGLNRALPGLAIGSVGVVMLALAQGQPAWVGGHIGPGLMAQLLGAGVTGLGAVWAMISAFGKEKAMASAECAHDQGPPGHGHSGPALLGAVLAFALVLPVVGLVLSAGLAAAFAAWGAGERAPRAMAATVLGLMALVAVIGAVLLPPTAPLWPAG